MNTEALVSFAPTPSKSSDNKEASPRADHATARHVNMGIDIQQSYGTSCAIEYMKAKGVSNHITARVLAHPDKRRPPK